MQSPLYIRPQNPEMSSSSRFAGGTAMRTADSADGVAGTIRQESYSAPLKYKNRLPVFSGSNVAGFAILCPGASGEAIVL